MIDGPLDVSNIISSGQNDDLYLTFTAFVEFPGIEEGSAEAIQRAENTCAMFRTGVQHSIEGIRKMAAEGRL